MPQQEPSLQVRLAMAMMAEEHGMAPGAADKCKVVQLFHESVSRSRMNIGHIERIVGPDRFGRFLKGSASEQDQWEVGYYTPSGPSQLTRLRKDGFCNEDFEELQSYGLGVPIASHAGCALQQCPAPLPILQGTDCGGERCLCVVLYRPLDASGESISNGGSSATWREHCVTDPSHLLAAYLIWYQQVREERPLGAQNVPALIENLEDKDRCEEAPERRKRLAKQQREYAKVRDPLIKVALQGLENIPVGHMSTVLLPSTSVEAESVVSLYLLGGGGARHQRPPGVDLREALGGVVVQRIENQQLFEEYKASGVEGPNVERQLGAPRYREELVWHGTRLKRSDGEDASLAMKLKSIAENGFDPQRCMKGAAAEGGIWVATAPLASFGQGCDGLVAFVLCLAKTHFNEWMDSACARVLQRERVLPLYAIVHA